MTDLRQAAQQALEALEANLANWNAKTKAITALREALAAPQPEPVKFNCTVVDDAHPEGVPLSQWGQQQKQKPFCYHDGRNIVGKTRTRNRRCEVTDQPKALWLAEYLERFLSLPFDQAAAAELRRLHKRVSDYEADAKAVMAEQCAGDEAHCSCVPHLRTGIKELQAENEALREALHHISLASQNSMSSKDECGRIARAALQEQPR